MGDGVHTASGVTGAAAAAAENTNVELGSDVDIEMALLTLSAHDMGEPTEDLDLSALTPNEKRVLLDILRKRLGNVPTSADPHPADVVSDAAASEGAGA